MSGPWHLALSALRPELAAAGAAYIQPMTHGTLRCVLYAPVGSDDQSPHKQDELYVITRGGGRFERDGEVVAFAAGDVLFVPAGMRHRFVAVEAGFECWAIFWGPAGGETLGERDEAAKALV